MPKQDLYYLAVGTADLERMTMLGDIYMPYCQDFLIKQGLKSGMRVADIGCGPGNVSVWLAKQIGPNGQVVAIDNSQEQLNILNQRIIEHKFNQIITHQLSIYDLSSLKEQFDLVFCRFLFPHLTKPLKALDELKALLKPTGKLILGELDNTTWSSYPKNQALTTDTQLLCKIGTLKGIDFKIGPKLYSYLRQKHYQCIDVKINQPVLEGKYRHYLAIKSEAWANTYLELGLTTISKHKKMINNLKKLALDENYLLAGAQLYLIAAKKEVEVNH